MKNLDPLQVNDRLYRQVARLLDMIETDPGVDYNDIIKGLIAIGRVQTIFVALRKENRDEPDSGSAVRKYAAAFKNAGRRRKARTRPDTDDALAAALGSDDDDGDRDFQ